MKREHPIRKGVGLAAIAAALFGVTAPFLQLASRDAGVLASGGLLYLGAALGAGAGLLGRRGPSTEAPIRGGHWGTLVLVAFAGGLVAPALLVWGLRRTDAASASLLLAMEAPLTLVLARIAYREHLGRRVVVAAALILAGGVVATASPVAWPSVRGALLVGAAALAWAVDNVASRRLADRDPSWVVAGKGLLGGSAACVSAALLADQWPTTARAAGILVIGAIGFGASLRLYLLAQRLVGAARTASVFSAAPFVGVAVALAIGTAEPSGGLAIAAVLVGAGVILHATERHEHAHVHEELEHEHRHAHDDGHHDHTHDPMPSGPHSHAHRHRAMSHDHPHGEDLHHRHEHEK